MKIISRKFIGGAMAFKALAITGVLGLAVVSGCTDNTAKTNIKPEVVQEVAASYFPSDEKILDIFKQRIEESRGTGYVLGMVDANGEVRIVTHGSAGKSASPLSADSVFEIASITKTFTGSLLADMVTRGEVRLDQPAQELMPEGRTLPSRNGRQITLIDLATHTSGLPRIADNMPMSDQSNPYNDYTPELMLDFLDGYTLPRDIGAQFEYSNLAVGLLGTILGNVHGGGYAGALKERIFLPLGMSSSDIVLSDDMAKMAVKGHDAQGNEVSSWAWDSDAIAGAGAIRSSLTDMLKYLKANMTPESTKLKKAFTLAHKVNFPVDDDMAVALNWMQRSVAGKDLIWHNGGTYGFRTFIGFLPEQNVGLVLLTNSASEPDDIALHLFDQSSQLKSAYVEPTEISVSEDTLSLYIGEYQLTDAIFIKVFLKEGKLIAQGTGEPELTLAAKSETEFFVKGYPLAIIFQVDEKDKSVVTGLIVNSAGGSTPAKKNR